MYVRLDKMYFIVEVVENVARCCMKRLIVGFVLNYSQVYTVLHII